MATPKQDVFDLVDAAEASTSDDNESCDGKTKQEQWFAPAMADADKFKGRTLEVVWKRPDNDK